MIYDTTIIQEKKIERALLTYLYWAISSAGVKISSAEVRLTYTEFNLFSPSIRLLYILSIYRVYLNIFKL